MADLSVYVHGRRFGRSEVMGANTALTASVAEILRASDIATALGPGTIFDGRFIGTFPRYTWSLDPSDRAGYNTYFTITQLAGQAPSGHDAVRHDAITKAFGDTGETSAWWTFTGLTAPAQGTTWYVKYRFRLNGVQDWGLARTEGGAGIIKASVIGDQGVTDNRVMTHIRAAPTGDVINIAAGMNTGSQTGYELDLAENVWHAIQVAVQSGSTAGAADGSLSLYLNNDSVGSPDGVGSSLVIPVADWDQNLRFGAGTMMAVLTGGVQSIDWADFMIADAFDATWSAGT